MPQRLTASQIQELCFAANIPTQTAWTPTTTGTNPPTPLHITVSINKDNPDLWLTLMTHLTEVPVSIIGTRTSHPSGALDDKLKPSYAILLPAINEKRISIGLSPVIN